MIAEATGSFVFGPAFKSSVLVDRRRQATHILSTNEARNAQLRAVLTEIETDNRLNRRPCPKCGNLVKPRLQGQHDRAYHIKKR